jgi:hypothetical protein
MDDVQQQIRAKREAAARARRIAQGLTNQDDRTRVLVFASDSNAQAYALERGIPAPAAVPVTRTQIRQQQSEAESAEPKDDDSAISGPSLSVSTSPPTG